MDQLAALPWPTTPDEFLAWEQRQEEKYEFDGQAPLPMNGGTREHALLEGNVYYELRRLLEGSDYRAYGATLKIGIGSSYRYPDVAVSRTEPERGTLLIPEPVVLFEVVSPSSETTDRRTKLREYRSLPSPPGGGGWGGAAPPPPPPPDRRTKLREYRSLPSVQRYVLLEQDECALTVYARTGTGWNLEMLGPGDTLDMPEIGVTLPVDTIYKDVLPPS